MKNFFLVAITLLSGALYAAGAQSDVAPVPTSGVFGAAEPTNALRTGVVDDLLSGVSAASPTGAVATVGAPRLHLAPLGLTNRPFLGLGNDAPSTNAADYMKGGRAGAVAPSAAEALVTQTGQPLGPIVMPAPQKPNEISLGRIILEGIGVQAAKTKQPLQLINPFASPDYGSPEDNVLRDPVSGNISGLKIFSLRF